MNHHTIIIGAGVSGLTSLKNCLQLGIQAKLFEKSDKLGGLWNFDPDKENGGGPAYESLETNTSKLMTAISDFPFPPELPVFPKQSNVLQYLQDYSDKFELEKYINYNYTAINIDRFANLWQITFDHNGIQKIETAEHLIICSGRHEAQNIPKISGIESFKGKISHSYTYKNPNSFKGLKVLVIGTGSSGIDIAVELSKLTKNTYLSVNSGSWFIPKIIDGKPYDYTLTKFNSLLPKFVREKFLLKLLLNEYQKIGFDPNNHKWQKLFPKFSLEKSRLTPNSNIFNQLQTGSINVVDQVESIENNNVLTKSSYNFDVDHIIFATGYRIHFPFFDPDIIGLKNNTIKLFDQIFHISLPNLSFIGMCNVAGPIIPLIELQSRYAAKVIKGEIKLPDQNRMINKTNQHYKKSEKNGLDPMKVQTLFYLDYIARKLKLAPTLFDYLSHPNQLIFSPLTANRYLHYSK